VVDHLEHRALNTLKVESEQAGGHEAHVTHGGVGHQLLHVRLNERHGRTVDDADDGEDHDPRHRFHRNLREEPDTETDHPVHAHFQEDAGQDDRTCSGGLHVCVWKPGMYREHRYLDGEGYEEPHECEHLHVIGESCLLQ